jgi:3-oxoadipate enol-lactonase
VTAYRPERHDQVVDLLAVLDGLGLDEVVLVGNSRGGQIALDFTLTHPGRVSAWSWSRRLSRARPRPTSRRSSRWKPPSGRPSKRRRRPGPSMPSISVRSASGSTGRTLPRDGSAAGPRDLALDMNRIALHAADPGYESEPLDAWSRLSEVHCPVLVVVGDLDLVHIRARAEELASRIAGARLQVMEGAAHLPASSSPPPSPPSCVTSWAGPPADRPVA